MGSSINKLLIILLAAGILFVGAYIVISNNQQNDFNNVDSITPTSGSDQADDVTNFEECVAAGNPVMESYPRQCRANGETFVEDIGNEAVSNDLIRVDSPRPNQLISSPLVISGEARGNWYFEATFPIRLIDSEENDLYTGFATAEGEWMTEDFVPFEVEITFESPEVDTGTLILEKSNPSGLPENADELRIPVQFN